MTFSGIAGELCISGDGVGRGYLNRPELTAKAHTDGIVFTLQTIFDCPTPRALIDFMRDGEQGEAALPIADFDHFGAILGRNVTDEKTGIRQSVFDRRGHRHRYPLRRHRQALRLVCVFPRINVEGTKRVIGFARKKGAALLHISTLSVSGNAYAEDILELENNEINQSFAARRFGIHASAAGVRHPWRT